MYKYGRNSAGIQVEMPGPQAVALLVTLLLKATMPRLTTMESALNEFMKC